MLAGSVLLVSSERRLHAASFLAPRAQTVQKRTKTTVRDQSGNSLALGQHVVFGVPSQAVVRFLFYGFSVEAVSELLSIDSC